MLRLDLDDQEDKELLRFLAIIVNRSLKNIVKIQSKERHGSASKGRRAVFRYKIKILEDLRRGLTAGVIWKKKTREFSQEDISDGIRLLGDEFLSVFLPG